MDKFMYYQEIGKLTPSERKQRFTQAQLEPVLFWGSQVAFVVIVTLIHYST